MQTKQTATIVKKKNPRFEFLENIKIFKLQKHLLMNVILKTNEDKTQQLMLVDSC